MNELIRLLIVDDDSEIRELLAERLTGHGFEVVLAANGREMFQTLETGRVSLIVLDVMMPGEDGLMLCRRLRSPGSGYEKIPVIFVTALGDTTDRVVGLELGADDYLTKPFQTRELVARIRAVLRRTGQAAGSAALAASGPQPESLSGLEPDSEELWHFDQWRLNPLARHLIDSDDLVVPLSAAEFRLLQLFLNNPGRILNRDQIMECQTGRGIEAYDRSDVQISRLRGKLRDNGKHPTIIKTMRGDGYMLAVPVLRGTVRP